MPPSADPSKQSAGSVPWLAALAFGVVAAVAVKRPFNPATARGVLAPVPVGRPRKSASADTRSAASAPATPTQIPAGGWFAILKRVATEIGNDRVLAVAAGVTFYALLAIFPAIVALVSLYGLFADASTISEHLNALSGMLPGGALEIVGEQVKRITSKPGGSLGFGFALGLATALWSANAGMKAVFDALNIVYDEKEKRNFFTLNAITLVFTIGALVFLMLALAAVVVLPIVFNLVGLGGVADTAIALARWPALLVVLGLALAVLYRYGPSRREAKWRWVSPGSAFAAVGWIAGSMLFSLYVSRFGSYNETYGSLGAAIGFMTWIWLSTTIILVGAEINAETEHQTAVDTTKGGAKPLGTRNAAMADRVA